MCLNKEHVEENWISLILRIAMGWLFFIAAYNKFTMGLHHSAGFIAESVKDTFLPGFLVVPYGYILPVAEGLIAALLFSGFKLRAGWVLTAAVLISLIVGLTVAKQSASDLYVYLVLTCAGIYFSRYDHCVLGTKK